GLAESAMEYGHLTASGDELPHDLGSDESRPTEHEDAHQRARASAGTHGSVAYKLERRVRSLSRGLYPRCSAAPRRGRLARRYSTRCPTAAAKRSIVEPRASTSP